MDKKITERMKDYIVIGLGRFGKSLATTLYSMGNEVLAVDLDQKKVADLDGRVSTAVSADASSYDILYSLGAQNFDCAIICIGDNLEASLISAQVCKELGIKYIIAKAINEQHEKILKALGVDLVIYPEDHVGKKLATLLSKPGINELVDLTDDFRIYEISCPDAWDNKTINELNIRKKYKISIVFIKRNSKIISPEADTVLENGDILIIAGDKAKIPAIANLTTDIYDAVSTINNIFDNNK